MSFVKAYIHLVWNKKTATHFLSPGDWAESVGGNLLPKISINVFTASL